MEISLLALIGIGLGTMFFGYFFGLFEGRGQGYKRRKREEPARELELLAAKQAAVPEATGGAAKGAPGSEFWLELGAEANGQPRLNLDGQPVDTSKLTPAQHKRLIDLMILMRPWVEANARMAPEAAAETPPPARPPTVGQGSGLLRTEMNNPPRPAPASTVSIGRVAGSARPRPKSARRRAW